MLVSNNDYNTTPGSSAPAPAPTPVSVPSSTPQSSQNRPTNRNNNRNQNRSSNFVPKIGSIEFLATSSENKGQTFSKFHKSLHHHVLATFKNSKDLSEAILNFTDPFDQLNKNTPTLAKIRAENNLDLTPPPSDKNTEDDQDKFLRESDNQDKQEMAKMIFNNEIKLNSERKRDLTQNLTILWATIMGQCTPALKEEVSGDPDYPARSAVFDSIWLLQSLQKITAGVNKTTNRYQSVFKAAKKFYLTQQTFSENIDEYFGRFKTNSSL